MSPFMAQGFGVYEDESMNGQWVSDWVDRQSEEKVMWLIFLEVRIPYVIYIRSHALVVPEKQQLAEKYIFKRKKGLCLDI